MELVVINTSRSSRGNCATCSFFACVVLCGLEHFALKSDASVDRLGLGLFLSCASRRGVSRTIHSTKHRTVILRNAKQYLQKNEMQPPFWKSFLNSKNWGYCYALFTFAKTGRNTVFVSVIFFRPSPSRLSPGRNTVFVPLYELCRVQQHPSLGSLKRAWTITQSKKSSRGCRQKQKQNSNPKQKPKTQNKNTKKQCLCQLNELCSIMHRLLFGSIKREHGPIHSPNIVHMATTRSKTHKKQANKNHKSTKPKKSKAKEKHQTKTGKYHFVAMDKSALCELQQWESSLSFKRVDLQSGVGLIEDPLRWFFHINRDFRHWSWSGTTDRQFSNLDVSSGVITGVMLRWDCVAHLVL